MLFVVLPLFMLLLFIDTGTHTYVYVSSGNTINGKPVVQQVSVWGRCGGLGMILFVLGV